MPDLYVFALMCFVLLVLVVLLVVFVERRWYKPLDKQEQDWYDTRIDDEDIRPILGVVSPPKKKKEDGNA